MFSLFPPIFLSALARVVPAPPDRTFEEAGTAVAGEDAVMLAGGEVPADLAGGVVQDAGVARAAGGAAGRLQLQTGERAEHADCRGGTVVLIPVYTMLFTIYTATRAADPRLAESAAAGL